MTLGNPTRRPPHENAVERRSFGLGLMSVAERVRMQVERGCGQLLIKKDRDLVLTVPRTRGDESEMKRPK